LPKTPQAGKRRNEDAPAVFPNFGQGTRQGTFTWGGFHRGDIRFGQDVLRTNAAALLWDANELRTLRRVQLESGFYHETPGAAEPPPNRQ